MISLKAHLGSEIAVFTADFFSLPTDESHMILLFTHVSTPLFRKVRKLIIVNYM